MTRIDNKCFLFGGGDGQQVYDEVHELNLMTYEWTLLKHMKYGYASYSESVIDKNIYLFGGINL